MLSIYLKANALTITYPLQLVYIYELLRLLKMCFLMLAIYYETVAKTKSIHIYIYIIKI